MDQTQLQQKIVEYYNKLPQDVQKVFASMSWMDKVRDISLKFNLNEAQITTLGTETTLAFLGIISLGEYEVNLRKEIAIPADNLNNLVTEIEKNILTDIRSQLTETYNKNLQEATPSNEEVMYDPKFSKLPQSLQDAIAISGYQKKLYEIATKYKLPVNKMDSLERVTVKFIGGEISPSQYESELAVEIGLPSDKNKELATDINDNIMKNIRDIMQSQTAENIPSGLHEVPKPPYNPNQNTAQPPAPEEHHELYKDAGVEILHNSNASSSGLDMIKSKLTGITSSNTKISDQSIPKINKDPYHEAIE